MRARLNTEPFSGRDLAKLVEHRGGVRRQIAATAGVPVYVMPNGAEVKVPVAREIPTPFAKTIAEKMGLTYHELRDALGHPVIHSSRPRPAKVEKKSTGATKADVQAAIATARRSLVEVEQAIKPGVRDSAFYGRVLEELGGVTRSATAALSVARAQGSNR